jgi:hypothetical protein
MYAKLALSFSITAVILVAGGFLATLLRLNALEDQIVGQRPPAGRPVGLVPAPPAAPARPETPEAGDPKTMDTKGELDWIVDKLQQLDDDIYGNQVDDGKEFYDIQTGLRQVKAILRRIIQGLGDGATGHVQIGWGLAPKGAPLDEATMRAYKKEAETFGITVKEGEVRVRGLLNFSPKVEMPIEYFVTRYPIAGHETLVHLLGNREIPGPDENPYTALQGLATALYKGMLAAGFQPGDPSHPVPDSDPHDPEWALATGDAVYLGVRYQHGDHDNVALATDWVIDPQADSVLPPNAFRFTGSVRSEDPDTGEDMLTAESGGLIVSVWPSPTALVEVALESSLKNDYTYNFARIPKGEGDGPLFLELIFSKTPIEPVGDGAKPIERPAPIPQDEKR